MRTSIALAILALLAGEAAHAKARPGHVHWDLFGEEDVLMGFKVGPTVTGFTAIQSGDAVIDIQSSMRFMAGWAIQFVYDVPRFEVDFFLNSRGGLNSTDSYWSFSIPAILKFAAEGGDKDMDFFAGAGIQSDFVFYGPAPYSSYLYGAVGTLGLSVDIRPFVFEFEMRYNVGFANVADSINGARPRDFQMLVGWLWHF
jgi:hypothetical protein